jgi:hypothetical protein
MIRTGASANTLTACKPAKPPPKITTTGTRSITSSLLPYFSVYLVWQKSETVTLMQKQNTQKCGDRLRLLQV